MQDERHRRILEVVAQEGKITIGEICQMFDVSDMTARRDLRLLDRQGMLRRVHGGALSSLGRSYEPPYKLRSTFSVLAKQAIGKKAAEMVFGGDSIALDVGTTTLEVARSLKDKHNLTIVTASLPIANEITFTFSLGSDVRHILTGGIVRPGELSMVGHIPENTYSNLHVDKAFIGIGGLSIQDGLTEYNLEDALVKRQLLKSAQKNIVVAEGAKIGRTTFAAVCQITEIQTVITDESAPHDELKALQDMGVDVVLVD